MLEEIDREKIAAFVARKIDQCERVQSRTPGIQIIVSGEMRSQIMLVTSTDAMYEGVVVGQLPHVVVERTTGGKNVGRRFAPEHKKPFEARAIDLTDEQVDAIVAAWVSGRSALTVPAVTHVYDKHGKIRT